MIETPYFIAIAAIAVFVALAFGPLRRRTRLSEDQDRADLIETNRRIEEIEREAEKR